MKGLTRELIAMRVAREFRDGMCINLGIGIPTLAANFIPEGMDVLLEGENGILGYGRLAEGEEMDYELINPSGQPVILRPGASLFHVADSFALIRGGNIDIVVVGGYQVSETGDLANWKTLGPTAGGIGGGMELVVSARRAIVAMEHTTASGEAKIVKKCTYPLTARRVVKTIITNLACIEVTPQGLELMEVAPGVTPEEVQSVTEPSLIVSGALREMAL